MARHPCNQSTNGKDWMHCNVCDGRVHLEGCTSKRNPKIDCCKRRHRSLYDAGHTRGLLDSAAGMMDYFDRLDD